MKTSRAAKALPLLLSFTVTLVPVLGQAPPAAPAERSREAAPARLSVFVLEGDNAINSISTGKSVLPVVEIRDQNEFPVEGATVVFTLPEGGAGGVFPAKQTVFTTRSDAKGQASAPLMANGIAGKFEIKVKATLGARTGEAVIHQSNSLGEYSGPYIPPVPMYKKWPFWAIVGAGATGAIIAIVLTMDSSPAGGVTITPGGPVVGPPH